MGKYLSSAQQFEISPAFAVQQTSLALIYSSADKSSYQRSFFTLMAIYDIALLYDFIGRRIRLSMSIS